MYFARRRYKIENSQRPRHLESNFHAVNWFEVLRGWVWGRGAEEGDFLQLSQNSFGSNPM